MFSKSPSTIQLNPWIKKLIKIPVVLHGASGVSEEAIKKAVSLGVNKINIDTDVRVAFTDGIKALFEEKPEAFDPRVIIGKSKEYMKKVVAEKITLFGSANQF